MKRKQRKVRLSAEERLMREMLANDASNGDEQPEWSYREGRDDQDDDYYAFGQISFEQALDGGRSAA